MQRAVPPLIEIPSPKPLQPQPQHKLRQTDRPSCRGVVQGSTAQSVPYCRVGAAGQYCLYNRLAAGTNRQAQGRDLRLAVGGWGLVDSKHHSTKTRPQVLSQCSYPYF